MYIHIYMELHAWIFICQAPPSLFLTSISLQQSKPLSLSSKMGSVDVEKLVYDVKLSSVVPSRVTGGDKLRELTNVDLAVKLHYVRGLYFFNGDAVHGLGIFDLKEPMFRWLDLYYTASGRIRRRQENDRPFIKCNDGGVRIVEANCGKTLDEWLAMEDRDIDDQLFYSHALGPDLGFSPLVFIQFTWFKCGGLAVGLSWAHVLGDAFSASTFMNAWGQIMAGHVPPQPLTLPNTGKSQFPPSVSGKPFSLKRVEPVGDDWLVANQRKMQTHSFHVSAEIVDRILSRTSSPNQAAKQQHFPFLAGLIWKSLVKIRGESEPKVVTVCTNSQNSGNEISSNSQIIGTVEAKFKVDEADIKELAKLMEEKMVDERFVIDEFVGKENEISDFILYGANLTFVNLEELEIYGLEMQGKRPFFVNYSVAGLGDEGVVLVLPGPENGGGDDGRVVTVVLPENEIVELKNELKKEWGIF